MDEMKNRRYELIVDYENHLIPVLVVAVNQHDQKSVFKAHLGYGKTFPEKFYTKEIPQEIWEWAWTVTHWMPLPEPPEVKHE